MEYKAEASKIQESMPGSKPKSASAADVSPQNGLTSGEAHSRLEKFGPNAMPDTSMHPLRMSLEKFWAPVPWMLEAAIILELALGKYVEADVALAVQSVAREKKKVLLITGAASADLRLFRVAWSDLPGRASPARDPRRWDGQAAKSAVQDCQDVH